MSQCEVRVSWRGIGRCDAPSCTLALKRVAAVACVSVLCWSSQHRYLTSCTFCRRHAPCAQAAPTRSRKRPSSLRTEQPKNRRCTPALLDFVLCASGFVKAGSMVLSIHLTLTKKNIISSILMVTQKTCSSRILKLTLSFKIQVMLWCLLFQREINGRRRSS